MQTLIFLAVFAFVAGAIGVGAYVGHMFDQRRTKEMAEQAEAIGFDFCPLGDSSYFDPMASFYLFSQGRDRRWTNLMRGEAGGLAVSIFDYRYTTGSGKSKHVWKQSVVCFHFDSPTLPLFSLRPESFWHKVGGWLGMKDIDFQTHPKFSSAYLLQGPDEEAIRRRFPTEVLDFFEANPGISIDAAGQRMLFYQTRTSIPPKEVKSLLARGFQVLKQFRRDEV